MALVYPSRGANMVGCWYGLTALALALADHGIISDIPSFRGEFDDIFTKKRKRTGADVLLILGS